MTRGTRRRLKALEGERVVLQTRDERSLKGILAEVAADCFVLSHFEYLNEAKSTDLPGEAIVLESNFSWMHRYAPADGG